MTSQATKWWWTPRYQQAFDTLKSTLSNSSVLGYYEIGWPTKQTVDAGPNGLGALLFQHKPEGCKPVACASRSLTQTETRYSQIKREASAIHCTCERFYRYLIGSNFVIKTDHMPHYQYSTNHTTHPPRGSRDSYCTFSSLITQSSTVQAIRIQQTICHAILFLPHTRTA